MKRILVLVAAGAAALLLILSIQWIPGDSIAVSGEGPGARILHSGLHWRAPFSGSPTIYRLALGPVHGDASLGTSGGGPYLVSFDVGGKIDPDRALAFREAASGIGVREVLTRAASQGLTEAAASKPPEDLASGAIVDAARSRAGSLLGPEGVTDVSLTISIDDGPTLLSLARRLAPERKAGLLRQAAEAAVAAHAGSWEAHTALGLVCESDKKFREAATHYLDALAVKPTALPPMAQLVRIDTAVGEYDQLERVLEAAVQADPNSVQHLNWLGGTFLSQGKLDRAEEVFLQALEVDPNSPVILNNLGGVYLKQNRGKEAIETFRKAVAASPGDRQSLYNLGVALCSQGKCREGVKRLLDAEKADPGKAPVLQAIASAYRSLGNRREAANWEKRAQEASAAQGNGGGP